MCRFFYFFIITLLISSACSQPKSNESQTSEKEKHAKKPVYKEIENDFYMAKIPAALSYNAEFSKAEKNRVIKHKGLLYNSAFFTVSIKDSSYAPFKGSVSIIIVSDANKGDLSIDDFVNQRNENLRKEEVSYTNDSASFNDKKVITTDYEYEREDSIGIVTHTEGRNWRWKEQDKFIEVDYSTPEGFELYIDEMERTVASIKLKPKALEGG